ncbi:MAG: Y-family DNA polymerase [Chitinophagia bacterium]|nr:Y-family DNA polymerase [Chitinophagia bacterium]
MGSSNLCDPSGLTMFAIVDCNSFYCSCERLFKPHLNSRPVVVLSNNDGCIISRTDEAKRLGIDMGTPLFESRQLLQQHDVAVFSSNYHLYGDMSMRVMDTLRVMTDHAIHRCVEVYSVDEAFVDLSHLPVDALQAFAETLRDTVVQWTGIPVSIGIAPTKVLSKVANRLAKKNKQATRCVMVLNKEDLLQEALERTDVADLWGIGRKYARKLKELYGVRMIKELNGEPCIQLKDPLEKKKVIATTRMFGKPVFDLQPLKEAIATFTSRAAEKLRRQYSAASSIDVFVVTNGAVGKPYVYDPQSHHRYFTLLRPTSDTAELIHAAIPLISSLYRPGTRYVKAGVMLGGIVPDDALQGDLFAPVDKQRNRALMQALDNINFSMRDDMVKFVASGLTRNWKMRQEMRSGRFTTRWEELYELKEKGF